MTTYIFEGDPTLSFEKEIGAPRLHKKVLISEFGFQ